MYLHVPSPTMYFYFHNISLQNRVIFCIFQRNRGESVASAKRKLCARGGSLKRFFSAPPLARNLCFAHALHSPLLSRNTGTQKIMPVLQAIVTLNQRNLKIKEISFCFFFSSLVLLISIVQDFIPLRLCQL